TIEVPATVVNPNSAAIRAMIRNNTAQRSMVSPPVRGGAVMSGVGGSSRRAGRTLRRPTGLGGEKGPGGPNPPLPTPPSRRIGAPAAASRESSLRTEKLCQDFEKWTAQSRRNNLQPSSHPLRGVTGLQPSAARQKKAAERPKRTLRRRAA